MLKKTDYIILALICFFFGIFLVSQFFSSGNLKKISQPQNNEVIALEVAKLTKGNADLRFEVEGLTKDLEVYRNSSENKKSANQQYLNDIEKYDIINGSKAVSGQGVVIKVSGNLITPQLVDLINAIKNIGGEEVEINGNRVIINIDFSQFAGFSRYDIKVLGNSKLLKSAMERKGGIIEQIATKDISFSIDEQEKIEIASGSPITFKYAKIIE